MGDTPHVRPTVVIAEPHHEIAHALQDVVALAGCVPVIVSNFESMRMLDVQPVAIVVRVATEMPLMSPHLGLRDLGRRGRPLIVALASNEADVAEAERLDCEVIARAPHQVQALYDALTRLASTRRPVMTLGSSLAPLTVKNR
jgi:hypothetical protein